MMAKKAESARAFGELPGKLTDISLLSCSASRPPIVETKMPPLHQSMKIEGGKRDADANQIKVVLAFNLQDAKDAADGFRITAQFAVTFAKDGDGFEENEVEVIVKRVSVLVVWPYWREFVQSTTTRMGLPPLRVPLINPMYLSFDTEKPRSDRRTRGTKRRNRRGT